MRSKNEISGIFIVGVGNLIRRDDGVGIVVAQRLKQHFHSPHTVSSVIPPPLNNKITVIEQCEDVLELLNLWNNNCLVFLIDAVNSGAEPGTIFRIDARAHKIIQPIFRNLTSHTLSLAVAIELGRTLNQLPQEIMVYGIEGKDFNLGEGLSPEVEKASEKVAEQIRREISLLMAGRFYQE